MTGIFFKIGDYLILEQDRGLDYAYVVAFLDSISGLPEAKMIKNIVRRATEVDLNQIKQNRKKAKETSVTCLTKIQEHKLPMKLVGAEFSFDASKIIFYFTAEGRVDFRNLVKDLAKIFKVMSRNEISVSLVAQSASEISTSYIVKEKEAEKAVEALNNSEYFSDFFEIKSEEVAIINITGFKILENLTKAKIFQALEKKNIHVKALTQGTEELNLSLVIDRKDIIKAINVIHDDLCEDFEFG